MQSNVTERTRSERKTGYRPLFVLLVAIVLIGIGMSKHITSTQTLRVGNYRFHLEVAATLEEQRLGLGGRASMPADHGMLFVFESPSPQCFWMKDTHFALDIVWLDAQKRITKIDANVSPDTYPATFCSSGPTQYVVELNAGQAARVNLRVGQTVDI